MSKKHQQATHQRRQVLASPFLGKSAVHEKSRKTQRRREKMELRKQWCPQSAVRCILSAPLLIAASS
ncbi:MAG: hypothetical protein AAF420_05310 [Pseudomonadota bacterium]